MQQSESDTDPRAIVQPPFPDPHMPRAPLSHLTRPAQPAVTQETDGSRKRHAVSEAEELTPKRRKTSLPSQDEPSLKNGSSINTDRALYVMPSATMNEQLRAAGRVPVNATDQESPAHHLGTGQAPNPSPQDPDGDITMVATDNDLPTNSSPISGQTAEDMTEPDWSDAEASRAWLERWYSQDDPSLGSPMYQFLIDLWSHTPPPWAVGMADRGHCTWSLKLCISEMMRWSMIADVAIIFDRTENAPVPFYPDPRYKWSDATQTIWNIDEGTSSRESAWTDFEASRTWLEERYRPNDATLGSPLFRMYIS